MTVAALALSILAILIAVASAWYTRQQAMAATTVSHIEAARRHDERTPTFAPTITRTDDGDRWALCLRLTSQWPLSRVEAEISEGQGVQFLHRDGDSSGVSTEELFHGQQAIWLLDLDNEHSPNARARITCYEDHESWIVSVPFDLAKRPRYRSLE